MNETVLWKKQDRPGQVLHINLYLVKTSKPTFDISAANLHTHKHLHP